jgi:hypothetical protein
MKSYGCRLGVCSPKFTLFIERCGGQRVDRSLVRATGILIEYLSRTVPAKATPNNPSDSPNMSSPPTNIGLWFNNRSNIGVSRYDSISVSNLNAQIKTGFHGSPETPAFCYLSLKLSVL